LRSLHESIERDTTKNAELEMKKFFDCKKKEEEKMRLVKF
jgi:hypothetical protein